MYEDNGSFFYQRCNGTVYSSGSLCPKCISNREFVRGKKKSEYKRKRSEENSPQKKADFGRSPSQLERRYLKRKLSKEKMSAPKGRARWKWILAEKKAR